MKTNLLLSSSHSFIRGSHYLFHWWMLWLVNNLLCFYFYTYRDPIFFFYIRNQGKSHSLEDLASPGSLHGGSKSPRLQRTMSVNQRSSPRSRFSVQENRFSFNNRGKSLKELSFRDVSYMQLNDQFYFKRRT